MKKAHEANPNRLDPETVRKIRYVLDQHYPSAESELDFSNPFECLIATILSAQCTDQRVNLITARLFQEVKGPVNVVELTVEELEQRIRSCNYYKTKSRHIRAACELLIAHHDGRVPNDREALMQLPGVGRKTANVVLSNAFGIPAIAVDTHVFRVSNRLGLAHAKEPLETERQLMELLPREEWSAAHHWLILHGRRICHARNPACDRCPLKDCCQYYKRISSRKNETNE